MADSIDRQQPGSRSNDDAFSAIKQLADVLGALCYRYSRRQLFHLLLGLQWQETDKSCSASGIPGLDDETGDGFLRAVHDGLASLQNSCGYRRAGRVNRWMVQGAG